MRLGRIILGVVLALAIIVSPALAKNTLNGRVRAMP